MQTFCRLFAMKVCWRVNHPTLPTPRFEIRWKETFPAVTRKKEPIFVLKLKNIFSLPLARPFCAQMEQQFLVTERIIISRANDVKSKNSEFISSWSPQSSFPCQRLQCGERILWSGHLCREDSSSEGGVITMLWSSCQTFKKNTSKRQKP